ncbi:hypothetical protein AAFF_G00090810 [Aldrovandia affinis]|uniref:Uncharacterized protein n=1 Tax=Aldrovandia affinis TaxID=143900 RepID=A0AAD7RVY3_9TELE|nr:hypothetical protein AAFF_G00090810 [Aldrovandia affinis]
MSTATAPTTLLRTDMQYDVRTCFVHQLKLLCGQGNTSSSICHQTCVTWMASWPLNHTLMPLRDQAGTHQWPAPTLLRGVSGKIRVPNLTNVPQLVQKSHQLCRVRATYVPPISDATVLADPPRPVSTTRSSLSSDLVALDPDNIMPSDVKDKFRALHREFDEVFDPQFKGYNGAVGPFQAKVNMGPVQPPQRKGRVPQYSKGQLQELQAQFDMLECLQET